MTKLIKIQLYFIFCLFCLFSFKLSAAMSIDTPSIKAGTARLTGRITRPNNKDKVFLYITVPKPITGEFAKHKVLTDSSGKFSIDLDVETKFSLVSLYTSVNEELSLLVKLSSSEVTKLEIYYNGNDEIENISISPDMNKYDMTQCFEIIGKMIRYRPNTAVQPLYDKNTDYFLSYAKSVVSKRIEVFLKNDTLLSKELNEILSKEISLFMYNSHVFDYEGEMMLNYRNVNDDDKMPNIQKIDKTYFRFLRDFKLNDPLHLYAFSFLEFQKIILQNEILALPEIGESDIGSWLLKIKAIMADLVGFNDGQYYDVLVANAYGRQMTEELRPLSERQIANINKYFKNGEIAKILFRKNKQLIDFDKVKSPAVVKDVSAVPVDKVIETIVSKHKGKVLFIDLWATWCVPCLNAMKEFRSTKNAFSQNDIAFMYLTNGSSPRKLWEEKIKGIGDEHYYLTDAQWEYMMTNFGFEAIPSYLLFNKEGVLVNKFTAFPGSEEVKKMIDRLL
jgi:thiol-disulfide isomerase/thioredoxin